MPIQLQGQLETAIAEGIGREDVDLAREALAQAKADPQQFNVIDGSRSVEAVFEDVEGLLPDGF